MAREYPYRMRGRLLWTFVFVSLAIAVLGFVIASDNDSGLQFFRVLTVSPETATALWWGVAIAGVCFFLLSTFVAIRGGIVPQRIVIQDKSITIPRARWTSEEVMVPFLNILDLSTTELRSQRFFRIDHTAGTFELSEWMLPNAEAFDDICAAVSEGVADAGLTFR